MFNYVLNTPLKPSTYTNNTDAFKIFSQNKTIFKKMLHVHSLASVERYLCNGKMFINELARDKRISLLSFLWWMWLCSYITINLSKLIRPFQWTDCLRMFAHVYLSKNFFFSIGKPGIYDHTICFKFHQI